MTERPKIFLFFSLTYQPLNSGACRKITLGTLNRYTAKQLKNQDIPGPDGDYQDLTDKRFMMASDHVGGKADARTELKSPVFKGNEHPLECFSFWFYFGVSCNSKCPLIRLLNLLWNELL